jgi:hypothetical protein
METSASFEARYAPLLYPTNHVDPLIDTFPITAAVIGQWPPHTKN